MLRAEFDAEVRDTIDELLTANGRLEDELEAMAVRLAESQARVGVLRDVIRENCMQMRAGVE